ITDELNVKAFELVGQAGQLGEYRVLPDNKLLGPRLGAAFPRVRAALMASNPAEVAARVMAGQAVSLTVDGETVELAPNEVLVQTTPLEGLAVAEDKGISVAVDAVLTPELRSEGLAREIVRRVQEMRKKAGFNIEDRIRTYYQAEDGAWMEELLAGWGDYLRAETLTNQLVNGPAPDGAYTETQSVEGKELHLGVLRA
nr:DUF5915 domain-containing protein [Anaerolinea sp.]